MKKNIIILTFLILIPIILVPVYYRLFISSGNFLENNANTITDIFIIIGILSSFWIFIRSLKFQKGPSKYFWITFSIILILLLTLWLFVGYSLEHLAIGG
jgi:hypothetical protein